MGTQDPLQLLLGAPYYALVPPSVPGGGGGFPPAPLQSPLLHSPSPDTPSPAELARVIHVWARLDVAFFWVVDGGGSGVSSSQDEHKAVEGDSWCILVICEDGRTGGQGQCVLASLLSLSQRCSQ